MQDIKFIGEKDNNIFNEKFSFRDDDIKKNKGIAALSYFFILFIVPFFVGRHSDFVKAHLKQGIVLCVVQTLSMFLVWIPFFGKLLITLIFIETVYAIFQTLLGKYWRLPVFGKLAEKITL